MSPRAASLSPKAFPLRHHPHRALKRAHDYQEGPPGQSNPAVLMVVQNSPSEGRPGATIGVPG